MSKTPDDGILPEPPTGSVVLFCYPLDDQPEDAWLRYDAGAEEGGYGDQHWYPLGRIDSEYPETWSGVIDAARGCEMRIVTATKKIPGTPLV
jgi:hypothetical protein